MKDSDSLIDVNYNTNYELQITKKTFAFINIDSYIYCKKTSIIMY